MNDEIRAWTLLEYRKERALGHLPIVVAQNLRDRLARFIADELAEREDADVTKWALQRYRASLELLKHARHGAASEAEIIAWLAS